MLLTLSYTETTGPARVAYSATNPELLGRISWDLNRDLAPGELASEAGLPVARKRDSQEICFVKDDDYAVNVGPGTAPPTNPFLLDSGGTDIQRSGSHFRTHSVRGTLSFRF